MPISISNLQVDSDAPLGTVVGILRAQNSSADLVNCSFSIAKSSARSFAVAGNQLVTAWNGPTTPGYYSVRISAVETNGNFRAKGTFAIQVEPPPPPPAPPPPAPASPTLIFSADTLTVGYSGPSGTDLLAFGTMVRSSGKAGFRAKITTMARPGNASIGFAAAAASAKGWLGQDTNSFGIHGTGVYSIGNTYGNPTGVTFGSGSIVDVVLDLSGKIFWVRANSGSWNGSASADPISGVGGLSMSSLSSSTLSPAVGLFDNGDSITGVFGGSDIALGIPLWGGTWEIPYPKAIILAPTNATIADNAPAETLIATAIVTMSHGSQFAGTLTTSDTNFFAVSGSNIVTARALTPADDGTHTTVITASQGNQSLATRFSI